jgi:hypothetical protein
VIDIPNDTPSIGDQFLHAADTIDALLDYEAQSGRLDPEQIEALELGLKTLRAMAEITAALMVVRVEAA